MALSEISNIMTTETIMAMSIVVFLGMSLIIWLKLKAMSAHQNIRTIECPCCGKSVDVAYNSIGQEIVCPNCSEKFNSDVDQS